MIEAQCQYRDPARYDDALEIATVGTLMSPVRVRFDYTVTRRSDDTALAAGSTVHAAVDAAGRPQRLPDEIRTVLS